MIYSCNALTCGRSGVILLNDISFELNQGEIIALVGPNGCGKTTLLHTMHGLLPLLKGDISLHGKSVSSFSRRHLASQAALMTSRSPQRHHCTVRDFLEIHTYCHSNWLNFGNSQDNVNINLSLEMCQITELANRDIRRLSDGEFQLIRLCAAIVQCKSCLLLDEPFSHLDPGHTLRVMNILRTLRESGSGIIVTIHDLNTALQCADKIAGFAKGTMYCFCSPKEFVSKGYADTIFGVEFSSLENEDKSRSYLFPLKLGANS